MNSEQNQNAELLTKALLDLSVESWRFSRLFARLLSKLDAGEGARYTSQYRYYLKRLEETLEGAGLTLVNVEGQDDKKVYVSLPYLSTPNAHILEAIIRLSFKKWTGRLSGLLND